MSRADDRGSISDLKPGTPVLVAGGGVTGRSVLAALAPLGVTATLCDDDPSTRQQFADAGTATVDSLTAAQHITDYALVVTSPGFPADRAGAGRRRVGRCTGLGRRRAGLAARRVRSLRAAATLARGHRHQRQDDHHVDAAGHAHGRGPAQQAVRQHRQPGAGCSARARRPAGRRAVQLPAALGAVGAPEAGVVLNIAEDHLDWHSAPSPTTPPTRHGC